MKNEKRQRQAIGGRDYSAEQGSGKSKNRSAKKGFFAGFSLGILAFVAAGCLLTLALWLNLGGLKEQVVGFFNLEEIEQAKIKSKNSKRKSANGKPCCKNRRQRRTNCVPAWISNKRRSNFAVKSLRLKRSA